MSYQFSKFLIQGQLQVTVRSTGTALVFVCKMGELSPHQPTPPLVVEGRTYSYINDPEEKASKAVEFYTEMFTNWKTELKLHNTEPKLLWLQRLSLRSNVKIVKTKMPKSKPAIKTH